MDLCWNGPVISKLNVSMTRGFPILQVLVPLSPLLGLVGTVSGMLEVFDSMAMRGSADARSMASGVSEAMATFSERLAAIRNENWKMENTK